MAASGGTVYRSRVVTLSRYGDVANVCRKGPRTLARDVLLAFAFPWLQRGMSKPHDFDSQADSMHDGRSEEVLSSGRAPLLG
jgi:hypothetical protein